LDHKLPHKIVVVHRLQKGSPWFAQTALIALDVRIPNLSEIEFGGTDIFEDPQIGPDSLGIFAHANGAFRPQPLIHVLGKRRGTLTSA
jgi:hypothetical protein